MTDAPERIWADPDHWVEFPPDGLDGPENEYVEYIRADLVPAQPTGGVHAIMQERERQITVEGWTPEHDDTHILGELGSAAACYAVPSRHRVFAANVFWPWGAEWWKPTGAHDDLTDRRRDLVKAGALIAAEIDRIDRLITPPKGGE